MPSELPDRTGALRGLMDAERVSEYLGIARGTLRSWENRRAAGKPGGPKDFPPPLADRLGGATLWEEADIVSYRLRREAAKIAGQVDPPEGAADL